MDDRFEKIISKWYLTEPALFQIYGTHNLEANDRLSCVMRSGKGKIEYNPILVSQVNDESLELYLKAEIIRILLKHPYDRQPDGCRKEAIAMGSNLVLGDNYQEFRQIKIPVPQDYNLDKSESFEWYSFHMERQLPHHDNLDAEEETFEEIQDENQVQENLLEEGSIDNEVDETAVESNKEQNDKETAVLADVIKMPDGTELPIYVASEETISKDEIGSDILETKEQESKNNASSQDRGIFKPNRIRENSPKANFDLSNLWEEDYTKTCEIDNHIEKINNSKGWGSLSGDLVNEILANTKARIDYRKVLSGFRATILSSKRSLTRMRPNRRTGFDNMGSIRRFNTNILVAVDVSGSVNDESLKHFYSIINRTFKYGIEKLDIIQFDTKITSVESMNKKQKFVAIKGRGGTNFQVVFDYATAHPEYDGLIIFTDGSAPHPTKSNKMKCKVAWICNTKDGYDSNHDWMNKFGRCCLMEV